MANVTEYLIKLQELTQTNLDILQAINDSFFTDKNHLAVNISGTQYALPSFLSLENKLNVLSENFENLIKSPETGEAYFCIDGNSRAIELKPYTSAPNPVILEEVDNFEVENNDMFKDFLTPSPYININLKELPNDITDVLVKKVIPINQELKNRFKTLLGDNTSSQYKYSELYKILEIYKEDVDYTMYDTITTLPFKKSVGNGLYVIKEIEDYIDNDLNEIITLKIRTDLDDLIYMNSLSYKLFDETITHPLEKGDKLLTYEGNAKLEIIDILEDGTLKLKVLNGEYVNLTAYLDGDILNSNKLKFFSGNESNNKIVKIPLEEDEYIFTSIAPINNRLNIQAPWGSGLLINTYKLTNINKGEFNEYYRNNVKNIGDILRDLTLSFSDSLSNYTTKDIEEKYLKFKPTLSKDDLMVAQTNKYITKSYAWKDIKANYAEKLIAKEQLQVVQNKILTTNKELSNTSFEDVSIRNAKKSELNSLLLEENSLLTSTRKIADNIKRIFSSSDIPLEAARYSVIGFLNMEDDSLNDIKQHITGIEILYKYISPSLFETETSYVINEKNFANWNLLSKTRDKIVKVDNDKLSVIYDSDETHIYGDPYKPLFNQIDIPINQWENVVISVRFVYDFSYPFLKVKSQWSTPITINFPDEFRNEVDVIDIVNENDKEIEANRFEGILETKGIINHINDEVNDLDNLYFHKPEHIASGFYTPERRIIPLKDKLDDMNNNINKLLDEVIGIDESNIEVSVKLNNTTTLLNENEVSNIYVEQYSTFLSDTNNIGNYIINDLKGKKYVTTTMNISIKNNSNRDLKLYPIIPGKSNTTINEIVNSKFDKYDYCCDLGSLSEDQPVGVWMLAGGIPYIQKANQYVTFRVRDLYTNEKYYTDDSEFATTSDISSMFKTGMNFKEYFHNQGASIEKSQIAFLYPNHKLETPLLTNSKYKLIRPTKELLIPITFEYYLEEGKEISKLLSFDIRTSLYNDPINYTFRVIAKYQSDAFDKSIAIESLNNNYNNTFQPVWAGNIQGLTKVQNG